MLHQSPVPVALPSIFILYQYDVRNWIELQEPARDIQHLLKRRYCTPVYSSCRPVQKRAHSARSDWMPVLSVNLKFMLYQEPPATTRRPRPTCSQDLNNSLLDLAHRLGDDLPVEELLGCRAPFFTLLPESSKPKRGPQYGPLTFTEYARTFDLEAQRSGG